MKKIVNFLIVIFTSLFICSSCHKSDNATAGPAKKFYTVAQFAMGVDLSFANQLQDVGAIYKDSNIVKDPFIIFKNHGANVVRVRLWHNPQWLKTLNNGKMYSDLYDVVKTIQRAKAAGMAVNLDFHYSDTWTDPSNQNTPAAWAGLSLSLLKDSVYNYTLAVLNYLQSQNCVPEMLQIGNETNAGMLWPQGQIVNNNFASFCTLLNSGIKAVRNFSATSTIKPQIILHVAQLQNTSFWATNIINGGVTDFDIIGISHYSKWATSNAMADITDAVKNFKTSFAKKIMLVETGYPFTLQNADSYNNITDGGALVTGYPITPQGQNNYLKDLTQAVISGGGSGVMYWAPDWITSSYRDSWGTGSSWDNMALFDFSSNALPALDYMNYPYQF